MNERTMVQSARRKCYTEGWKRIIRDHVPVVNWSNFADSAELISPSQQNIFPRSAAQYRFVLSLASSPCPGTTLTGTKQSSKTTIVVGTSKNQIVDPPAERYQVLVKHHQSRQRRHQYLVHNY